MSVRFATQEELTTWNSFINANPDGGNILQGKEFIDQKVAGGWTARYFFVDTRAVVALEKQVFLLGRVWYIPKGPSTISASDLSKLIQEIRTFAKKNGVFSVKIEPELDHETDISSLDLIPTKPVQQNFATVIVDLSPSLDDIMKNLDQKARHAIRRAERDGVTVKAVPANGKNNEIMYTLLKETAKGAGFVIRPSKYYADFYRAYESIGKGQLFFAYFEGKVVAGAFAMVQGTKSMYKDGASIRQRTAYGASHLLQWHVIQWAKDNGSLEHDLAGVPPIKYLNDPNHPFSGLARFKTSFNKKATQYVGAFDIPVIGWKAVLWHRFAEKVARRLHLKRHGQSYY